MVRHIDSIITTKSGRKLRGSCRLIETDVVAGWCGVDLVSRVTFEHNTANALYIDVEGTLYRIPWIRRRDVIQFVRFFLESKDTTYRHQYRYDRRK